MIAELKNYVNKLIDQEIIPGAEIAVITPNQVKQAVYGDLQVYPERKPHPKRGLYDVASLTKVIATTPVILQLIEKKQLKLTDRVSKYLPQWRDSRLTVRHLLTHTSDVVGYIPNRNQLAATELKQALLGLSSGNQLGKQVRYQDINFLMLGWIAEQITGENIHQLATDRVIRPLQLPDATFEPQLSTLAVVPTAVDEKRGLIEGVVHDPKTFILGEHSGAAGLFASLEDLIKVSQWLLNWNNKEMVLSNQMKLQLFRDQTPQHTNDRSFGWDLRHHEDGHEYLVHTGFTGPVLILDRHRQVALAFLTNRVNMHETTAVYQQKREKLIQIFANKKDA